MHATICRHEDIAGSTEEVMHAGRRLAMALSKLPGFVTYALLEAGDGVLASVSVFETSATLVAAGRLVGQWVAEGLAALLPSRPQVLTGEVVVQKGM